jgi:hypothetical protein
MSAGQIEDRRALAYDGLGRLGPALAARRASLGDSLVRRGVSPWYHYARLLKQAGDTTRARDALEAARAQTTPEVRAMLTLDPLPSLRSPLIRGWGPIPGLAPPPAPRAGAVVAPSGG